MKTSLAWATPSASSRAATIRVGFMVAASIAEGKV
jgi:hypothetical protein